MITKFNDIIKLLQIKGYVGNQYDFLKDLIEASVDEDKIYSINREKSHLLGFYRGDSISGLAGELIEANFDKEKLSSFIRSLYELTPKSKTYITNYGDEKYSKILYERILQDYPDIDVTKENMADVLADIFCNIITAANDKASTRSDIAEKINTNVTEILNEDSILAKALAHKAISLLNEICRYEKIDNSIVEVQNLCEKLSENSTLDKKQSDEILFNSANISSGMFFVDIMVEDRSNYYYFDLKALLTKIAGEE